MSLTDPQAQFAAEFVTLTVAACALAFVAMRPAGPAMAWYRRSRAAEAVGSALVCTGLLAVAAAAFLHGSLLLSATQARTLGALRVAGILVAVPLPSWSRRRAAPVLMGAGAIAWAGAGCVGLRSGSTAATNVLLVAGAAAVGAALLLVSRRAIAMRVAASAAGALLAVVLVLSLALASAITSSVQRSELDRLANRAKVEGSAAQDTRMVAVAAQFAGEALADTLSSGSPDPLVVLASNTATGATEGAAAARVARELAQLSPPGQPLALAYLEPAGRHPVASGEVSPATAVSLARGLGVLTGSCGATRPGVVVGDGGAWLVASYPECTSSRLLGVILSLMPLGDAYVAERTAVDPSTTLTLVSGRSTVAGPSLTRAQLAVAGSLAASQGSATTGVAAGTFVSVVPLRTVSGRPLSVVLTASTASFLATRTDIYRTLFLIALGGTVLALGIAVFTGDRITSGIRRLTVVASWIQAGNRGVRAGIPSEDEVGVLGSAFDTMVDSVAEHASALESAAEDETRLRNRMEAVVEGMSEALVAIDVSGEVTDFNRAAEVLTGVPADAAVGRRVTSILRLLDDAGAPVPRSAFSAHRAPWAGVYTLSRRNGSSTPVAVSAGALRGTADELAGTVLVLRDLTREQEVERMKSEFLSRVGHELRTPLTGIMGYTEILLRRDVPSARRQEWHAEILQSARRLLRIIEMLEFFATSGAGRMSFRAEAVDVAALVTEITNGWSARLPENLEIRRRVAANVPVVQADPRWLTMAVDELIDNAVKFSPDGGRVMVGIACHNGNGSPSAVDITVADRGVGMTPEEHAVVFSEFVQGDSSDTRRFGGLGLGLAVVRRVVEGHGGEVDCQSRRGRGTTFRIRLPAGAGGRR